MNRKNTPFAFPAIPQGRKRPWRRLTRHCELATPRASSWDIPCTVYRIAARRQRAQHGLAISSCAYHTIAAGRNMACTATKRRGYDRTDTWRKRTKPAPAAQEKHVLRIFMSIIPHPPPEKKHPACRKNTRSSVYFSTHKNRRPPQKGQNAGSS